MSMFKEHYVGAFVAYTVFFTFAILTWLGLHFKLDWQVSQFPIIPFDVWRILACFVIAVLSGLWPDVDIKSKSQRLFYRVFLILNIGLIFKQMYTISAFLGIFAMLPLIGKHRGWTHSRIIMFILPIPFLLMPMYSSADSFRISETQFDYTNLEGLPFYLASIIGYGTHLQLDGILFRGKKTNKKKRYL